MNFLKKREEYKFCPVCGTRLKTQDAYCIKCGYSFVSRHKSAGKKVKWKNIIIFALILIAIYLGIEYYTSGSIIPEWIKQTLNATG